MRPFRITCGLAHRRCFETLRRSHHSWTAIPPWAWIFCNTPKWSGKREATRVHFTQQERQQEQCQRDQDDRPGKSLREESHRAADQTNSGRQQSQSRGGGVFLRQRVGHTHRPTHSGTATFILPYPNRPPMVSCSQPPITRCRPVVTTPDSCVTEPLRSDEELHSPG